MSMQVRIALLGRKEDACHLLLTKMDFYSVNAKQIRFTDALRMASRQEIELYRFVSGAGLAYIIDENVCRANVEVSDVAIH